MNAADSFAPRLRRPIGLVLFLVLWSALPCEVAAQIIGQRIEPTVIEGPKVLQARESVFTTVTPKVESTYRKEAGAQTFVLGKSVGESRREWTIGGQVRPLAEVAAAEAKAETVVERRVKFLSHEGKRFVKIEATAEGILGHAEEVRFSGFYETTVLEGDWAGYEKGGKVKVRLGAADHERYLEQTLRTFFDPVTLAAHADEFRKELLGILEKKLADPGQTPPAELEAVRRIVASAKAHPATVTVAVAPSLESDPEVFVLEGDTMISTTINQVSTLRFRAGIRDPGPTPGAKP